MNLASVPFSWVGGREEARVCRKRANQDALSLENGNQQNADTVLLCAFTWHYCAQERLYFSVVLENGNTSNNMDQSEVKAENALASIGFVMQMSNLHRPESPLTLQMNLIIVST